MDPVSGNERPGPPTETLERARISQASVANTSLAAELLATQTTVVSQWNILVKRGSVLRADSIVEDEFGIRYFIEGAVANRPERHPKFRAATMRLVSDMQ